MYKIEWDKKTGGIRLNSYNTAETLGTSPRPVFYEELDLLKLNELGWKYPKVEEPLLWCINKTYYYRGEKVMDVKGANIYDPAEVSIVAGYEHLKLKPVDVEKMLEVCNDEMFLIESEAIEFIRDTYVQYANARKSVEAVKANQIDFEALVAKVEKQSKKKMAIVKQDCDSFDIMPLEDAKNAGKKTYHTTKIDIFLASFSGGKDSQVVLDLCTRAIPPDAYEVIYSDTGYELPPSLELYDYVQKYYHELYPNLKFSTARNHEKVLNYWEQIGTPSDKQRWCCKVMKTAPLYRMLKKEGTNIQAKVLAFEGVRAEESASRSGYERIGVGVKHGNVINARPIFRWNTGEIFLYLFRHKLPINKAYRLGKPRVGCIFCPFSSPWDDMIVNRCYSKELAPFLNRVVDWAKERKIPNLDEYIKERSWGRRASGSFIKNPSSVVFKSEGVNFYANVKGAKHDLFDWLPVLCEYTKFEDGDVVKGELKYDKIIYPYEVKYKTKSNYEFCIKNVVNSKLITLAKRVVYKAVYCISCEACEVECPTGALSVYPQVKIDNKACIHCHKCLTFHEHGCIVADSLNVNMENKTNKGSISKYGTFGIHEEWIDEYFSEQDEIWQGTSLGPKQKDSFKAWLKDAEIIDSKNKITPLGVLCQENYIDNRSLIWEVIWINLVHNSALVKWFAHHIGIMQIFDSTLLKEMALEYFKDSFSTSSITYAITGLMQLFKYSPIGEELYQGVAIDKKSYKRDYYQTLSEAGLAYSLYKYAALCGTTDLRVSSFYDVDCECGPVKEFNISKDRISGLLRSLNSDTDRILIAELNMGLDNITLKEDLTAYDVLKKLMV